MQGPRDPRHNITPREGAARRVMAAHDTADGYRHCARPRCEGAVNEAESNRATDHLSGLRNLAQAHMRGTAPPLEGFEEVPDSPAAAALSAFGAGPWLWLPQRQQFRVSSRFLRALGFESVHSWESESEFLERVHPDDRPSLVQAFADHIVGRWPLLCELRLETAHGDHRWFRTSGLAGRDHGAAGFTHVAGCVEDISERVRIAENLEESRAQLQASLQRTRRMQEQLLRTSRAAGMADVASAVLHSVGNSVNSLGIQLDCALERSRHSHIGALQKLAHMLQNDNELTEHLSQHPRAQLLGGFVTRLSELLQAEAREQRESLEGSVECCKSLIRDLQQQSKLTGQNIGFITDTDTRTIIQMAVERLQTQLDERGLEVGIEVPEGCNIRSDADKLTNILVRVLENSMVAVTENRAPTDAETTREPPIRIVAERMPDGGCRISVFDTGPGIPNEIAIFRMGWTTRPDAAGIGLHIAAVTAQSLHGSLRAQLREDGTVGSQLILEIPAMSHPSSTKLTSDARE